MDGRRRNRFIVYAGVLLMGFSSVTLPRMALIKISKELIRELCMNNLKKIISEHDGGEKNIVINGLKDGCKKVKNPGKGWQQLDQRNVAGAK